MLASFIVRFSHLAIDTPPGWGPQLGESVGATRVKYIEFLENNTHLIYPALAVLTLVLVGLGIVQALRSTDVDLEAKAEIKREIIRILRHDPLGMTVETLAKNIDQPLNKLGKLLEEMQDAGLVDNQTDTRRRTTWRVRGVGDRR